MYICKTFFGKFDKCYYFNVISDRMNFVMQVFVSQFGYLLNFFFFFYKLFKLQYYTLWNTKLVTNISTMKMKAVNVNIIYLFIEGLQPSEPHRVTPGLFTKSNLTKVEYNTKHAHFTNVKHKHNPKVSPFGIALIKYSQEMLVPLTISVWRFNTRKINK